MQRRGFIGSLVAIALVPSGLRRKSENLAVYCDTCREGEGWICEQHPERHFPHETCNGPGMPCFNGCNPLAPSPAYEILDGERGLVRFFLRNGPRDVEIPLADWLKNRPGESPLLRDWAHYSAAKYRRQGLYG